MDRFNVGRSNPFNAGNSRPFNATTSNPFNAGRSNSSRANQGNDDSDDNLRERIIIADLYLRTQRTRRQSRRLRMWPVGLSGADYIQQVLNNPNPTNCRWQFRMGPSVFQLLADTLVEEGQYQPTRGVTVEEALAMCMKVIGFGTTHRDISDRFCRSLQTVNKCVHRIIDAMLNVGHIIIRPRHILGVVDPHIYGNPKYDPWFRNCIGAIDGTHVVADGVPPELHNAFRNRNRYLSQNVLAVCDFNMLFTYVYPGWEGSAHDNRVLTDALSRPELGFPIPPPGYFYVVDSGYPCKEGFLPPYKGEQYHLSSFVGGGAPRGPRELFNRNHSSLRNVIERCFGALKKRCKVLKRMNNFELNRQAQLVTASCVVHNFIRLNDVDDRIFHRYSNPNRGVGSDSSSSSDDDDDDGGDVNVDDSENTPSMLAMRDYIAENMWAASGAR